MSFKINSIALILLAAFAFAAIAPRVHAESTPDDEKEAKEAKEEEEKEGGLAPEVAVKGKVALNPLTEEGKIPTVAGVIAARNGKEYQLKLADPKILRAKLVKVGAKECQLRGYFRNSEKYLVVTDVDFSNSVPPAATEGL